MPDASVIPAGHAFLNIETFISIPAKDIAEKMLQQASNRCPDNFDMYIYNDFYSYRVMALLDNALTKLHGKIKKEEFTEAYYILEALGAFNDLSDAVWAQSDDGGRVNIINKALEACGVAVFRGVKDANMLDPDVFPSLESVLQKAAEFSEQMHGLTGRKSDYALLCKAIARRLFKDRSYEVQSALEMKRLEEWGQGRKARAQRRIGGDGRRESCR